MASEPPPPRLETGNQPPTEDAPPAYDDATGTLDVHQDGLSAQSQVTGQRFTSFPFDGLNLVKV